MSDRTIHLTEAVTGVRLKVTGIGGGHGVRQRLFALGLHINDTVELSSQAILRGPVLIKNLTSGTSVALGRGIAQKILVEILNER